MLAPHPPLVKIEGVLDVITVVLLVVFVLLVGQAAVRPASMGIFPPAFSHPGLRFAVTPHTEAPHRSFSGWGQEHFPYHLHGKSPLLMFHS